MSLAKSILFLPAIALFVAANDISAYAQFAIFDTAPALNADAQQALKQQFRSLLEPKLKAELSFAIRVTKPSDAERRKLIAASVNWLDGFVDDFIKHQDANERQFLLQGLQRIEIGGNNRTDDPLASIEQGVATVVGNTLTADKVSAYETEAAKRAEFHRDVVVSNLVVQLDEKLNLAPDQRERIYESLFKQWDDKWPPGIESFAHGSSYFLPVPQDAVLPVLTKSQRTMFERHNGSAQRVTFFHGQGDENEAIDDVDLDEQPAAEQSPPIVAHPVADQTQHPTN